MSAVILGGSPEGETLILTPDRRGSALGNGSNHKGLLLKLCEEVSFVISRVLTVTITLHEWITL